MRIENRIKEYHLQQKRVEERRQEMHLREKLILEEKRKEKVRRMDKHRIDVYA